MIKGVIFDLDGTLIDSMTVWSDIDRRFLMENGVEDPPPDVSERVRKMTVPLKADGTSISPEFADFLKRRS